MGTTGGEMNERIWSITEVIHEMSGLRMEWGEQQGKQSQMQMDKRGL